MDKNIVISPEITSKKKTFKRKLDSILPPLIKKNMDRINSYYLKKKWSRNADPRHLDWKWDKINFNRIAAVNLLLNKFKNPNYLEIGCASNSLFNSVPTINKIGVDPSSGGNVRKTSDEFFKDNEKKFDVVFIDGLHTYEQVRRDVNNSIKSSNQNGWIALHDLLPKNWIEQHVPIITKGSWTGDVWKVAFELLQTEGIEFKILKIDYGVGVIKVLNNKTSLKDLRNELLDKEFSYYYENLSKLPVIDWIDAQEWLRS
jgi:hypothetical protein